MKKIIAIAFVLSMSFKMSAQDLVVYDATKDIVNTMHNNDFSVKVRKPGGEWKELFEYGVKVDQVVGSGHSVQKASMAYFDFSGTVEVAVTSNNGAINKARIRPLSYGIKSKIKGNTLSFTLSNPANLSVEINDDIFHNLHLFANPIEKNIPDSKDPNVIYFGPGIHEVPNQKLIVPSDKTVYLAGGTVLKGQIALDGVSNVNILGRGIVDQEIKLGISVANSKNVNVEGVFASQCFTGGSDGVKINNVKTISFFGWGDGMNVMASNNVFYDGVFVRSSDDCTTVYGTRKGFKGGCKNVTMQNSTLWADVGHPILIGTHGNSDKPDVLENLNYINIDILDQKEMQVDYQGCLAINVGDNNLAKNVLFENIRVEDFREGQLLNLRVYYNTKYCTAPGLGIEDVVFRNIEYNGNNANLSIIAGYNEQRKIKNVTFENLKINGVLIHDEMKGKPKWYKTSDMARFFIGEHVEGVSFKIK
ncbi:glycosyl hydrolase family 28 protein [Flavobacterium sp. CF136]|uniref:glycosyl hydrolase family 28 protein n=1 Tax=Flavobacterium sp. (strain CF136) TaxID=1144313 RepID=UPI000271B055|nr:glycosyl hydrolase family 28 protein [Flavobacterium sp. CF136]EJL64419.1 Glycosyl hydrolases family 28 [Flavobacterium sp. CF136]